LESAQASQLQRCGWNSAPDRRRRTRHRRAQPNRPQGQPRHKRPRSAGMSPLPLHDPTARHGQLTAVNTSDTAPATPIPTPTVATPTVELAAWNTATSQLQRCGWNWHQQTNSNVGVGAGLRKPTPALRLVSAAPSAATSQIPTPTSQFQLQRCSCQRCSCQRCSCQRCSCQRCSCQRCSWRRRQNSNPNVGVGLCGPAPTLGLEFCSLTADGGPGAVISGRTGRVVHVGASVLGVSA
jgi:hypothetical protein